MINGVHHLLSELPLSYEADTSHYNSIYRQNDPNYVKICPRMEEMWY